MRHQVYKCICDKPGTIKIDKESTTMTCGVVGLVSVSNCRLINTLVLCDNCNGILYKETR